MNGGLQLTEACKLRPSWVLGGWTIRDLGEDRIRTSYFPVSFAAVAVPVRFIVGRVDEERTVLLARGWKVKYSRGHSDRCTRSLLDPQVSFDNRLQRLPRHESYFIFFVTVRHDDGTSPLQSRL